MHENIITLTNPAIEHIKKMLEKTENGVGFRLSIKKTGCSGYAYVPDIIETVKPNDIHFVCDGLDVYVDPTCKEFIENLIIDYLADSVGLKQKRLVFINPNEKNRCGCGESFTIE